MKNLILLLTVVLFGWPGLANAQDRKWRFVLVDKQGTRWSYDELSHQHKDNGEIELWVKKVYDQKRIADVFRRYNTPPSSYDLELWSLLPDRRITLIQAVRYRSNDTVLETFRFSDKGRSPTVAFPPDSAMDGLWTEVMQELHHSSSQGPGHRHSP